MLKGVRRQVYGVLVVLTTIMSGDLAWACSDSCGDNIIHDCSILGARPFLTPANSLPFNLALLLEGQGQACLERRPSTEADNVNDAAQAPVLLGLNSEALQDSGDLTSDGQDPAGPWLGRCQSNGGRSAGDFVLQVGVSAASAGDKASLIKARETIGAACVQQPDLPEVSRLAARDGPARLFASYLLAASAFYRGDFVRADKIFLDVSKSRQPWLAETANYMLIRVSLNKAQLRAVGKWGEFDVAHTDKMALRQTAQRIGRYLKKYPKGQYAHSAQGLYRRVYWMLGDTEKQVAEYTSALESVSDAGERTRLIVEMGRRLPQDLSTVKPAITSAVFFAARLSMLHPILPTAIAPAATTGGSVDPVPSAISGVTAEVLAQPVESWPTDKPEWATYLQLAQRYYVDQDFVGVVQASTDAGSRSKNETILFSTQVLHGLALDSLHEWPDAEKYWRKIISQEKEPSRNQFLQQALVFTLFSAGHFEQALQEAGKLPSVLKTREDLLIEFSSPVLRKIIGNANIGMVDRAEAIYQLLSVDIRNGQYAEFVQDEALAATVARAAGGDLQKLLPGMTAWVFDGKYYGPEKGTARDDDDAKLWPKFCPTLIDTARLLAANPHQDHALVCMGNYRRNIPSALMEWTPQVYNAAPAAAATSHINNGLLMLFSDELPQLTAGLDVPDTTQVRDRMSFFLEVIGSPTAAKNDRAYALYTAINCINPYGDDYCGKETFAPAERKHWFILLKTRYGQTPWGRSQKVYR